MGNEGNYKCLKTRGCASQLWSRHLNIAVIGAGIGGLAAALCLE